MGSGDILFPPFVVLKKARLLKIDYKKNIITCQELSPRVNKLTVKDFLNISIRFGDY